MAFLYYFCTFNFYLNVFRCFTLNYAVPEFCHFLLVPHLRVSDVEDCEAQQISDVKVDDVFHNDTEETSSQGHRVQSKRVDFTIFRLYLFWVY